MEKDPCDNHQHCEECGECIICLKCECGRAPDDNNNDFEQNLLNTQRRRLIQLFTNVLDRVDQVAVHEDVVAGGLGPHVHLEVEADRELAPAVGADGLPDAGGVVGVALGALVIAVVLMGLMNWLGGAGVSFRQAFSVTSYAFLPSAISSILALVVMLLKNPEDFDLQNPLPANLGAFLSPQDTPKWLHALASSFDLFSFWLMLLLALGFSVASGKKLKFGKALTLILVPWALVVLIKMGVAGLQG